MPSANQTDTAATSLGGRLARFRASRWHLVARILVLLAVAVVVVAVLRDKIPSPQQVGAALRIANWWWVVAAAVAEAASIGMFVRQQRRLLAALGVPVSLRRVGAITYSSNSLANSLPGGAAVSAGYSYREFRAAGASARAAATVMVLSGVLSIVALVLLYLAGLGAATVTRLLTLGTRNPLAVSSIGIAVVALILVVVQLLPHHRRDQDAPRGAPTPRLDRYQVHHPRLGAVFRHLLITARSTREIRLRDWNLALTSSAAKWLLDAACLYLSCRAFGISIAPWSLAAVYLSIQLVRQIPLTPGGIGLIEGALMVGLLSAGAHQGPAAAAVLIYRLLSAWLLIPIGFIPFGLLRRRARPITDANQAVTTMLTSGEAERFQAGERIAEREAGPPGGSP